MAKRRGFNLRVFVSLFMTFSFLVITVSGIILYIAPPGRIAHWSYWSLLWLTKTEWQAVHTIFTFISVIAAVLHIIYNWKPLISYLKTTIAGIPKVRGELIYATLFSLILFVGTLKSFPPFSWIMDFGEVITDSWSNEKNEPPIPHAERLTISELALETKFSTTELIKRLQNKGYDVKDSLQTLEEIAVKYNVVPSEIYNKIFTGNINSKNNFNNSASNKYVQGSGYGRKNISEIFEENNLTWAEGIKKLKSKNIIVTGNDRLKNIATQNNVLPIDIINAIVE
jgi:hypothetical protein